MTYISMQEHIRHSTVPCMIRKKFRKMKPDVWHIREEYLHEKYTDENEPRDTKMCIQEGLHICSIQEFFCEIHRLYVMIRVEAKYPLIQTRIQRESLRILTLMKYILMNIILFVYLFWTYISLVAKPTRDSFHRSWSRTYRSRRIVLRHRVLYGRSIRRHHDYFRNTGVSESDDR